MSNHDQSSTTSADYKPGLKIAPRGQQQLAMMPLSIGSAQPFPLPEYSDRIQASGTWDVAGKLLSEAIDARLVEITRDLNKMKGRVIQLGKIKAMGVFETKHNQDSQHILNILGPRLEILLGIEKLIMKHPIPTDKQWAPVLSSCGNDSATKRVITTICRHLDLPAISSEAWEEASYLKVKMKLLDRQKDTWAATQLSDYAAYLERHQELFEQRGYTGNDLRFKANTKIKQIRAANKLLEHLQLKGLIDIREMRQHHLDEFFCDNKGALVNVGSFIKHLSRKGYFVMKFQLHIIKSVVDLTKLIPRSELNRITDKMLCERVYIQEAILFLLAMYYAQPPRKMTRLLLSQLENTKEIWTINYGRTKIPLHPEISSKLQEWLGQRRAILAANNITNKDLLFFDPKNPFLPLSVIHLHRKLGGDVPGFDQLKANAIVNLYQNGVRSASGLTDTIGISTSSAMLYLKACAELRLGQAQVEYDL
jgi:integrase